MIIIPKAHQDISVQFRAEDGHDVERADMILAKCAADKLNAHYPGHLWAVNVNSEGGVMIIKNYNVSYLYGYILHLKNVYHDRTLKSVMRAGGEILERAHLKTGRNIGEDTKIVEGAEKRHQPVNGLII